jgi:hypothetical protein
MQSLSIAEFESQSIIELPDRDLMGAVYEVTGGIDLCSFGNMLNHTFHNWSMRVVANGHVEVTVADQLTETQVTAFCNATTSTYAAQCTGRLT